MKNLRLPRSKGMEMCVLGSILIGSQPELAYAKLTEDDFYYSNGVMTFSVARELFDEGKEVDIVSVCEAAGLDSGEGGMFWDYLQSCINVVPVEGNIGYYIKIVKEKARERERIKLAVNYYEGRISPEELVGGFESNADIEDVEYASESIEGTVELIEKMDENDEEIVGVPTGFNGIDRVIGGFRRGELIILAARPGMGKSILALNFLRKLSIDNNIPTGIFSYEMSKRELNLRLLYSQSRVNSNMIKTHRLNNNDWQNIINAGEDIKGSKIFISDNMDCTVWDVFNTVKIEKKKNPNLAMVVVDYIQLMNTKIRETSREREIARISRGLKKVAKRLDITVVAISQLNRSCEQRREPKPKLSDLRESGAIEQDADIVMLMYREGYYFDVEDNLTDIIIAKNRNGFSNTAQIKFDGPCMRFEDIQYYEGGE